MKILVLNSGSSSQKACIFEIEGSLYGLDIVAVKARAVNRGIGQMMW